MASINAEKQPLLGDTSNDKKHYGHNVPVAVPVTANADGISSRSGSVSSHTSGTSTQCCRTSGLISNGEALMNLLKGNIGTGILAMADAFMNAGLVVGIVGIFVMGFIATHCMHLLDQCNQALCSRPDQKDQGQLRLDYAEVMEGCVKMGPPILRPWASKAKLMVNIFLCITQFGFCTVYVLFVADNIRQVVMVASHWCPDLRIFELLVFAALVPYSFVTNLKVLSWFASFANILTAGGLVIVFQYCIQHLEPIDSVPAFKSWGTLPLYFGTAIYAFEGIALVLPVKIEMRDKAAFGGLTGVLNTAMVIVTVLYSAVGFYGYLRFGDKSLGSITLNMPLLPVNWLYLSVRLIFGVAIFISYGIQFYVPIEILYPPIKKRITTPLLKKYGELILRTVMVMLTFALAVAIPHLNLMISLIGALSSSSLALIFPPIMEMLVRWPNKEYGRYHWRLYKDILIIVFGIIGFIAGTIVSIIEIIKAFQVPSEPVLETIVACNRTLWQEYRNGTLVL